MDSSKAQKVKARKTKMMLKKSTVQNLPSLCLRAMEITVVIITVAKLVFQLVVTFENSGERFKGLAAVLVSRHFVFFAGNAIVIWLIGSYGQLPNQASDTTNGLKKGFYEEFVRESQREEDRGKQSITGRRQEQRMDEKRERDERKSISEGRSRQNAGANRTKQSTGYVRSRSESLENPRTTCRERLKRSETERYSGRKEAEERTEDPNCEMSNDELLHKIESFIARQRRNQKDYEFCIA